MRYRCLWWRNQTWIWGRSESCIFKCLGNYLVSPTQGSMVW